MPQIVPQARREDQPWDAGSVGILAHTSQVMDESSDSRQLPDPRVLQASPPQAGQMLRSPSSREPEGGGELGTRPLRAPEKTGPAAFPPPPPPVPEAGTQPLAPSQARQKFPLFGSRGGGRGAFLGGDIIRDLQLPRCPARTPARPAPRGPPPLCPPTARPAPARTKLAPGPLGRGGARCGLHAVPGLPYARPGMPAEPPGPPGPPSPPAGLLPASAGAPERGGERKAARVAARPPVPGVREAGCGPA